MNKFWKSINPIIEVTYSMEQGSSWKTKSFLGSQQIPSISQKTNKQTNKCSLPYLQQPAIGPYSEPDQ
jgi:hypothetical protein